MLYCDKRIPLRKPSLSSCSKSSLSLTSHEVKLFSHELIHPLSVRLAHVRGFRHAQCFPGMGFRNYLNNLCSIAPCQL